MTRWPRWICARNGREGAYFIMCDVSHLGFPDDVAFARYLTTEVGRGGHSAVGFL